MDLKSKISFVLREHYGSFETNLEIEYESKLIKELLVGDMNNKKAWVTYNQVILELKNNIKDNLKVSELQYRLTEDIDPNKVCISLIEELEIRTDELNRLYDKIRNL
jgi:hypothetical protein